MKMLKELNEYKILLQEDKALRKRTKQFLDQTVFKHKITVKKIPKDEKVILKRIKEALILNNHKYPWVKLSIYDYFLDDIHIFGREEDIFDNLERTARMVALRQESMIGNVSISRDPNKFSLKNFI
jgi:hypothetical protein